MSYRPISLMYRLMLLVATAGTVPLFAHAASAATGSQSPVKKRPQVEVVFCLDTTGSMGGLIDGAKRKIWAISNQIASGLPTPQLKIGLVAFRDRGDDYITRVIDLTDDLDAIHSELMKFKAQGGGDEPESVNQALSDSVNKIKWSKDAKTMRMIFLVGDAPPHMDYPDDIKFPVTCKLAAERGIIINSVQCGGSPETRKFWQEICTKAEGSYVQIAQDGGVVAVATPYDKDLARINTDLAKSTLTYGNRRKQAGDMKKAREAEALPAAAGGADRAAFAAKSGTVASYDLIDSIKDGKVKLREIQKDQLPAELQKMTPGQQEEYLSKLEKRRTGLRTEAVELDKKRSEFIAKKLAAQNKGGDGFDSQVLEILRKQAKKFQIDY